MALLCLLYVWPRYHDKPPRHYLPALISEWRVNSNTIDFQRCEWEIYFYFLNVSYLLTMNEYIHVLLHKQLTKSVTTRLEVKSTVTSVHRYRNPDFQVHLTDFRNITKKELAPNRCIICRHVLNARFSNTTIYLRRQILGNCGEQRSLSILQGNPSIPAVYWLPIGSVYMRKFICE